MDDMATSASAEAAQQLRRFLEAVHRGELRTDSGYERALLRRLEGAVAGLEAGRQRGSPSRR
jgi:hypothetical protein